MILSNSYYEKSTLQVNVTIHVQCNKTITCLKHPQRANQEPFLSHKGCLPTSWTRKCCFVPRCRFQILFRTSFQVPERHGSLQFFRLLFNVTFSSLFLALFHVLQQHPWSNDCAGGQVSGSGCSQQPQNSGNINSEPQPSASACSILQTPSKTVKRP